MESNKLEGRSRGSSFRRRALTLVGVSALTLSGVGAVVFGAGEAFAQTSLSSGTFTVGSLTSVTGVSATVAPAVPGGTSTYRVSFTATTAVASGGKIVVTAAAGTTMPTLNSTNYAITDFTTSSGTGVATAVSLSSSSSSSTSNIATITIPNALNAGDQVVVAIAGVTNPSSAGSYTLTVNTTSDLSPVSASYALSGTPVSTFSVSTNNPALSGTATYSITGITAASSLNAGVDGILLTSTAVFPPGYTNYSVTDVTTGASGTAAKLLTSPTAITGGYYVELQTPINISSGDIVDIAVAGMTNPSTGTSVTVGVAPFASGTYTAPTAVSATGYSVGTLSIGTAVSSVTLSLTNSSAGASSTYTVGLTTSTALTGGTGTISVSAPSGTVLPASGYSVVDLTNAAGSGAVTAAVTPATPTNTVTVTVPNSIGKGDSIELIIPGVTNPGAGTFTKFAVNTSTDTVPVNAPSYTIGVSSSQTISVSLSTTTVGAVSNWTIGGFQAGTSGIPAGHVLTLTVPLGTGLPSTGSQYSLVDLTNTSNTSTMTAGSITNTATTSSIPLTLKTSVPANDLLQLAVTGVLNPTSGGNYTLTLVSTIAGDIAYTSAAPAPAAAPNAAATGSNGALVNVNGTIYVYAGGVAFGIPTPAAFNSISSSLGNPTVVSASSVTTSGTVANGTLLQVVGSPEIGVVSGGAYYGFSTASQFTSEGYSWSRVIQVPNLGSLTTGSGTPPNAASTASNGALVNVNGTIYVYAGGIAAGIPTPSVFSTISAALGNPAVVNASSVITTGNMATGTLVQVAGSPQINVVTTGGVQVGFATASEFTSDGYSWGRVILIP